MCLALICVPCCPSYGEFVNEQGWSSPAKRIAPSECQYLKAPLNFNFRVSKYMLLRYTIKLASCIKVHKLVKERIGTHVLGAHMCSLLPRLWRICEWARLLLSHQEDCSKWMPILESSTQPQSLSEQVHVVEIHNLASELHQGSQAGRGAWRHMLGTHMRSLLPRLWRVCAWARLLLSRQEDCSKWMLVLESSTQPQSPSEQVHVVHIHNLTS